MKKVIIGYIMIQILILEPIFGYIILHDLIKIDDTAMTYSAVLFGFLAIPMAIFSFSIVNSGYKEMKIETPF